MAEPGAGQAGGQDASGRPVPVLYIAGFGRSGSTLLDRLLGAATDLHSGGELANLWKQGLAEDRLCSCGAPFSGCTFWKEVGAGSFTSLRADEVAAFLRYLNGLLPVWRMWRLLTARTRAKLVGSAPPGFFAATARLYTELRDVSGCAAVVDSSKLATYLVLLGHIPSVRLHVVHLVRDPRAVTHSWLRPLVADPDGRSSMPRFGVVKSALLWLIMNAAVEWVARRLRLPYVRVRYEDLAAEPARTVAGLRSVIPGAPAGPGWRDAGLPGGQDADLGVAHTISGNPVRFARGRVPIVEDAGWKAGSRGRRTAVAVLTFPLRWRYGY